MERPKYDIFISYRREDGFDYARLLHKVLEINGYNVFLDSKNLNEGNFFEQIKDAINEAPVFMMILSPGYCGRCHDEKDWVRQEIMLAINLNKYIIPVNPDGLFAGFPVGMPDEIKSRIATCQFADVRFDECFESSIDKLLNNPVLRKKQINESVAPDLFLAYARRDYVAGDKLTDIIQSNGFSVWRDTTGIMAGEKFEDCILHAISNSKAFIALYSSWALESAWFNKELEYAKKKNIPVIKVLTDTPEGLSGTRRMTFGTMLEMGSERFEEKLLSGILNSGSKSDTTQMFAYGKELYDRAHKTNDLQEEYRSFDLLLRAAELGNSQAQSYVEQQSWDIDLGIAVSKYIPINRYFVDDMRADLYNRGVIIAEDPTLTDNHVRGAGMERSAFRMMKRAIDLGQDAENPISYPWYFLQEKDFAECLDALGNSSRINVVEKKKVQSDTGFNIFISYKRVNDKKVFAIKQFIEENTGQRCWIDLDGVESDAQFANVIIKAINNAKVFLFMYSQAHSEIEDYDSDWTVREINFAQKKKKRIVFVNIDGSPLTDWFELMFGTKQQIDASSKVLMDKLCRDLMKWLK